MRKSSTTRENWEEIAAVKNFPCLMLDWMRRHNIEIYFLLFGRKLLICISRIIFYFYDGQTEERDFVFFLWTRWTSNVEINLNKRNMNKTDYLEEKKPGGELANAD